MPPALELPKQTRSEAVNSIQRYFRENMPEEIGELGAGLLLDFFCEELAPLIYNRAIADAQAQLTARVGDLSGELYMPEFQYWPNVDRRRKKR